MSAYRDELQALRERLDRVEGDLDRATADLAVRTAELADRDERLARLRDAIGSGAPEPKSPRARRARWAWAAGSSALGIGALGVALLAGGRDHPDARLVPMTPASAAPVASSLRPPITIAVVLDSRPSMASAFPRAIASITILLDAMRDDDRIGVVQVGGSRPPTVVQPISPVAAARATLPAALRLLHTNNASPWDRAASEAVRAGRDLLERSEGDARILVVTDGKDGGWELAEGAAGYAARQGFRVSAFGAGEYVEGYPQSIARAGHGSFADLGEVGALDRFVAAELGPPAPSR